MAIKIKFDSNHNAELPTCVLAKKNGNLIGKLPVVNVQVQDTLNSYTNLRFDVNKHDIMNKSLENSKVKINGFNLTSILSASSGNVRIGEITEEQFIALRVYGFQSEQITNGEFRIKKGTQTDIRLKDVTFSTSLNFNFQSSTSSYEITISDKNNTTIGSVSENGYVYLKNPSTYGLSANDYIQVDFSFYMPVSVAKNSLWESIRDFRLIWAKEWNEIFEIQATIEDGQGIKKNVNAISLGESELSNIKLYEMEINTENDIARDDYKPTVLFSDDKDISLLDKIIEKAPHYSIAHVDNHIKNLQRTFEFNDISIIEALRNVGEEFDCLIIVHCYFDQDRNIVREISVYDLESHCLDCMERGTFTDICSNCGSSNIVAGYGEDTNIFISSENLAETITFETDKDAVKNCFKLEAGDDLMTATIASCNPNGSSYIWYLTDEMQEDMSNMLKYRLRNYNALYHRYQTEETYSLDNTIRTKFNDLISKYSAYTSDYFSIPSSIVGYPALMENYYNAIDFYWYLSHSLMPNVEISRTNAGLEGSKLNTVSLSPVAVQDLSTCSLATANNAVLQMAKVLVNPNFKITIQESTFAENTWNGIFVVTNYSDEEDTYTSRTVSVTINDNYEKFVKQKIDKLLNQNVTEVTDIISLFGLELEVFKDELEKYSLSGLNNIYSACQSCIDTLIEQGISNPDAQEVSGANLYTQMYMPYYNKLQAITEETQLRENEIKVITGIYNSNNVLVVDGVQTLIEKRRNYIQELLNFQEYLGEYWNEFISFRREDTYSNQNYISDGLSNAELIASALEFIKIAENELYKSANLQHSISATLKNLLVMKEFEPIVDSFEIGNWLRVRVDDNIHQLRLIDYTVDYENLDSISVTFSDVKKVKDGFSDVESILENAKSIASSYDYVSRQASKGRDSKTILTDWANRGMELTNMKIIGSAENQNVTWDSHGFLCREYDEQTESYSDQQLKIINKGLYVTNDNWRTSKAGIGNFLFFNPETHQYENAYGVIADTLVGNLILSEKVGIFNPEGSTVINHEGITITADQTILSTARQNFVLQRKDVDANENEYVEQILYIDTDGNLRLSGGERIFLDNHSIITDYMSPIVNMLPSAYYDEIEKGAEFTENGITWVTKKDGTIVATGTATSDTYYYFTGYELTDIVPPIPLDYNKTYTFSGCTNGSNKRITCCFTKQGMIPSSDFSTYTAYSEYGDGESKSGYTYATLYIRIYSGCVCPEGGLIFKPMLEIGDKKHNYVSSHLSTGSIINDYIDDYNTYLDQEAVFNKLTNNGSVQNQGIYIDGTTKNVYINATLIKSGYLTGGTNIGDQNSYYLGISGIGSATIANHTDTNWRLTVGQNFGVTQNGIIYATGADLTGSIKATSGQIGGANGWTIDTNKIYNGTLGSDSSMFLATTNLGNNTSIGGRSGSDWRFAIGSKFGVTNTGALYGTDVNLTGVINANSGQIGGANGWTIDTNKIYNGMSTLASTGSNGVYLGTDGIALGGGKFKVTSAGVVTASDITVSGGTISGSNIIAGANGDGSGGYFYMSDNHVYSYSSNGYDYWSENNNNHSYAYHLSLDQGHINLTSTSGSPKAWWETGNPMYWSTFTGNTLMMSKYDSDSGAYQALFDVDMHTGMRTMYVNLVSNFDKNAKFNANIYDKNGSVVTGSDYNIKHNITLLDLDKSAKFIYSLIPSQFKYDEGTSNRNHHGFIAQDVKSSMGNDDWGVYVNVTNDQDELEYIGLRYEEFIADIVATLQYQKQQIETLQTQISLLTQ